MPGFGTRSAAARSGTTSRIDEKRGAGALTRSQSLLKKIVLSNGRKEKSQRIVAAGETRTESIDRRQS